MATNWREIFEFDKELVQERENGKKDMIADMLRRGKKPEEIVDFCGFPMELMKEVEDHLFTTA